MFAFRTVKRDCLQHALPRTGIFPLARVKAFLFVRSAASRLSGFLVTGFLALGCIPVAQASPQNSDVDEQKTTIRGTVVNAVTHAAITRALVHSTDNRFAMLTDGDGHFEFDLPKAKTDNQNNTSTIRLRQFGDPRSFAGNQISLEARKPGFLDNRSDGNRVEAYVGSDVTIPLVPEALIKGRVTLSTADAATGVTVQIFFRQVQDGLLRWVPGMSARANSAGEFRIAELAAGPYKLLTHELRDNDPAVAIPGGQAYGYAPVFYPGAADFASAETIELAAGQTFEADISLTHQPYYDVKIPVANAEASGGGLNVTVSVQGHRGPGYTLGYNGGAGRIEGALPNGNYVVEGETYGQSSSTGTVNLKVAGAAVEGPPMTLVRNSSISVDVREEFAETVVSDMHGTWSDGKRTISYGGPRAHVQVMAEPADDFERTRSGSLRPPTGPNDNQLIIEDLPPGRYWIRVNSAVGYAAAVSAGATDLLHEPLTIAPGSNTPIEVKMRDDFAELDGTVGSVMDAASASAANSVATSPPVYIYCVPMPESAGQFQQTYASSDGKFQAHAAPGDYRVLAFANRQSNLPYHDAEAMRAYESKGQVVHLGAGQKMSVQLQVIPSE